MPSHRLTAASTVQHQSKTPCGTDVAFLHSHVRNYTLYVGCILHHQQVNPLPDSSVIQQVAV